LKSLKLKQVSTSSVGPMGARTTNAVMLVATGVTPYSPLGISSM